MIIWLHFLPEIRNLSSKKATLNPSIFLLENLNVSYIYLKKKKELYQNNSSDHYGKYYTNKKKTFYNQSPNIDILLNFDGQIQKHETALRRKECL